MTITIEKKRFLLKSAVLGLVMLFGVSSFATQYRDCGNPLYPGFYNSDVCPKSKAPGRHWGDRRDKDGGKGNKNVEEVVIDTDTYENYVCYREKGSGRVIYMEYRDCSNPLYPGFYNDDICP